MPKEITTKEYVQYCVGCVHQDTEYTYDCLGVKKRRFCMKTDEVSCYTCRHCLISNSYGWYVCDLSKDEISREGEICDSYEDFKCRLKEGDRLGKEKLDD